MIRPSVWRLTMFEKFSRSWALVKASAAVLRADKELLWLPAISGIVSAITAATFVLPAAFAGVFGKGDPGVAFYVFGFLFYLAQYTVIIFFNTALVGAAMIRLGGGDPTVGDGLRIAFARLPAILGYAAIAAVVGVLLKALENRKSNMIVRMVVSALGTAWTVATYLVVPVLVAKDVGPIDALKESVTLLKRSWGENLIGTIGLGTAFGLITTVAVIVGVLLVIAAAFVLGKAAAFTVAAFAVFGVVLLAVIQAALSGIYQAALYRYASGAGDSAGFDHAALAGAFQSR
jgi:Family of unknown function (DUF6159)